MAEQVAIPAGVDVSRAIPSDAAVTQRGGNGQPQAGLPVIPPSGSQEPGFVAPAPAATGDAADFAAFLAWKATQGGATPAVAPASKIVPPVAQPAAPAASNRTPGFEGMGADGALSATKAAATGDPYLMSTFSMFEMVAPEVDLARAVGNALDRGDVSLIDTKYLAEKGGDKAAKLIEIAKGLVTHVTNTVEALTSNIFAKAGGQAQWDASVEVFNKAAPQYLKEFVASSIDSANPARINTAVESLLSFVKEKGGLPVAPQGHVRAGGGAPNAALGLSKAEYQAERMKLNRNDRDYGDKERELTARRQIGKAAGK